MLLRWKLVIVSFFVCFVCSKLYLQRLFVFFVNSVVYLSWDNFEGASIVNAAMIVPVAILSVLLFLKCPIFHDEFRVVGLFCFVFVFRMYLCTQ